MLRGDFHTHSTLDDGKSSLADMAAAAHALGLTHFGFSGHSWCPEEADYCIPREKIGAYLSAARALQREYEGRMEISVGLELDFYGDKPEGLDYVIGSVHGLYRDGVFYTVDESPEASRRTVEEGFGGDWYRYTDAYYDLVAQLPERTGCHWVGHFDLVTKFNQVQPSFDETGSRYLRRPLEVLEHLARRGVMLEVNTGAMARGYRDGPYPAPVLLRRFREFGGEVILNSDAHHTSHLCHAFPQARQLLQAAGFRAVHLWSRQGRLPQPL